MRKHKKLDVVGKLYSSGLSSAEVARVNKVGLSSLTRWEKQYSTGGAVSINVDDDVISKLGDLSCATAGFRQL